MFCPSLTAPDNGTITCSPPGEDGLPSLGDTCTFTCDNGYELNGSSTRNCQNDGNWSDIDPICSRGE